MGWSNYQYTDPSVYLNALNKYLKQGRESISNIAAGGMYRGSLAGGEYAPGGGGIGTQIQQNVMSDTANAEARLAAEAAQHEADIMDYARQERNFVNRQKDVEAKQKNAEKWAKITKIGLGLGSAALGFIYPPAWSATPGLLAGAAGGGEGGGGPSTGQRFGGGLAGLLTGLGGQVNLPQNNPSAEDVLDMVNRMGGRTAQSGQTMGNIVGETGRNVLGRIPRWGGSDEWRAGNMLGPAGRPRWWDENDPFRRGRAYPMGR